MNLPKDLSPYAIDGYTLKILGTDDKTDMMRMQEEVLLALPDPNWYFPSEEWEFDQWLQNRDAVGYMDGNRIAGYAVMTEETIRAEHSYAEKLGHDRKGTYDLHDVMVRPDYRRQGMQGHFLKLFSDAVRLNGGRAIYATVDPGNGASWRNFEREGYRIVTEQAAYDGRQRRFYMKEIDSAPKGSTICTD